MAEAKAGVQRLQQRCDVVEGLVMHLPVAYLQPGDDLAGAVYNPQLKGRCRVGQEILRRFDEIYRLLGELDERGAVRLQREAVEAAVSLSTLDERRDGEVIEAESAAKRAGVAGLESHGAGARVGNAGARIVGVEHGEEAGAGRFGWRAHGSCEADEPVEPVAHPLSLVVTQGSDLSCLRCRLDSLRALLSVSTRCLAVVEALDSLRVLSQLLREGTPDGSVSRLAGRLDQLAASGECPGVFTGRPEGGRSERVVLVNHVEWRRQCGQRGVVTARRRGVSGKLSLSSRPMTQVEAPDRLLVAAVVAPDEGGAGWEEVEVVD